MYRSIIKPILFSLTIERAHRAVLILLRAIGLIPGGRWLLRKCYAVKHPALEREVFGIKFANPVGLAAGFDRNGEAFRELAALGFGFVEVGTVTPRPQAGNPRPRVFRLPKDEAIINRIGLSNRRLEKTIQHLRRPHEGFIVGCNIGRNTATLAENAAADYLKLFRNLYQYADYFTVNISCDNSCREGATHTREHILRILDPLFDFRRGQNQYRPIMLKVSPDMPDAVIDEISDILLETPLDGIVATNGYIYNGPGLVRDICRALVADAEAKAAEEKAAAAQATAEQPAVQQAAAEQPAKEQPAPQSAETQPEAENAEPAPAESRTPAQSGPDSEQPES